jgi:hypothetical protein
LKIAQFVFLLFFCSNHINNIYGQTTLDFSVGSSFQDNFNAQIAIRNQFNPRFSGGFEYQTGMPRYRFVGTKVMREGYTHSLSLPVSYLIQNQEKIQLYGIGRLGVRFQGIIDPDNNDMRDSILASTAALGEFGLISTFKASEKVNLQGGMTFPIAYEISPLTVMEYMWVKLHIGGSTTKDKTTFYAHYNIGAAFGASGDTYKYIWSLELGARYAFGEKKNKEFKLIETAF